MDDLIAPALVDYLEAHATAEDEILRDLAAATREQFPGAAGMQVSADEGRLLTLITQLTGARTAVEVGVFTGYSALCIARGLPADGHLLACDVSDEWTSLARVYWKRAGVDDRIDLRIAPAIDTLRALPGDPVIDLAFVDADKPGYRDYYAELVPRLRPGGVLLLDNVLMGGRVLDAHSTHPMRALNDDVVRDDRVDSVMLPVRDGVTLVRKR
ncbi:O-methyltransferase [Cryptosporangium phraense]|uniref:SAM-dependent methyltransferase n=1 Tax=Cryptosporangium phraense TaxID=2593070 RepID=A0A545B005_9ACTN|nr:class I SAM-dependent methyltransferase [Cryptosporangium phraense]TQS46907.1 SAM-dependent methyltransferase [Cryptosporangium phraense]